MSSDHFQGKTVVEHLKDARQKGATASSEIHGTEMPGHLSAFADGLKEIALGLLILWAVLTETAIAYSTIWAILILFSFGWVLWKTGRSALLGWARIERLHRVIEEERWEIEHHRYQEKEELTEMYRAKGLEGRLLEEVIDVLMADDNRLLQIMLEEELGLTLEAFEHPLKQASGALCGTSIGALCSLAIFWIFPSSGIPLASLGLVVISSLLTCKLEKGAFMPRLVWNLAIAGLSLGATYFLAHLFLPLFNTSAP